MEILLVNQLKLKVSFVTDLLKSTIPFLLGSDRNNYGRNRVSSECDIMEFSVDRWQHGIKAGARFFRNAYWHEIF